MIKFLITITIAIVASPALSQTVLRDITLSDTVSNNATPSIGSIAPNGVYIYELDASLTSSQTGYILNGFSLIEIVSDIVFIERTTEQNGYVQFFGSSTCFAPISYPINSIGRINIAGGGQCATHEILHSLGFLHEHARPDNASFVTINRLDSNGNNGWGRADSSIIPTTPYDFDSVMHYGWNSFSIYPGVDVCVPHSRYARWWRMSLIGSSLDTSLSPSDIWGIYTRYQAEYLNPSYTPPPKPFTLQTPDYGSSIASTSFLFIWEESESATSYTFEIATNPTFSSPLLSASTATNSLLVNLSTLQANKAYFWKVTAINSQGSSSGSPLPVSPFFFGASIPSNLYVDDTAPPNADGSSWSQPLDRLEYALSIASCAEAQSIPMNIYVAQGTYEPTWGESISTPLSTFDLYSNVSIKGGYAGYGALDPNERNYTQYKSTLDSTTGIGLQPMPLIRAEGVTNGELSGFHLILDEPNTQFLFRSGIYTSRSNISLDKIVVENQTIYGKILASENRSNINISNLTVNNILFGTDPFIPVLSIGSIGEIVSSTATWHNISVTNVSYAPGTLITLPVFQSISSEQHFANLALSNNSLTPSGSIILGSSSEGSNVASTFPDIISIVNATIVDNSLPGGFLFATDPDSQIFISNSIVYNTTNTFPLPATISSNYSAFDAIVTGTANIDVSAISTSNIFTDYMSNNYSPALGGILVDAGNVSNLPSDILDLDNDMNTLEPLPLDISNANRIFDDLWTTNELLLSPLDIGTTESQATHCRADLFYDGTLDSLDVTEFQILLAAGDPRADFNNDGLLNHFDISQFLADYNAGCPVH